LGFFFKSELVSNSLLLEAEINLFSPHLSRFPFQSFIARNKDTRANQSKRNLIFSNLVIAMTGFPLQSGLNNPFHFPKQNTKSVYILNFSTV